MNTYEFIRQIMKLDPTGDMQIMLSVKYAKPTEDGNETVADACGFVDGVSIEHWEDGEPACLILEATDM